jgi:hypothetical protein
MIGWITLICGVLWIVYSLILNTKNFVSAIFFKVIPFFTGLASIFVSGILFGFINI